MSTPFQQYLEGLDQLREARTHITDEAELQKAENAIEERLDVVALSLTPEESLAVWNYSWRAWPDLYAERMKTESSP